MEQVGGDGMVAISAAQLITSLMFKNIGVPLSWPDMKNCAGASNPILVTLCFDTPPDLFPGALAYSQPFEGVHVRIFLDRISAAGGPCPRQVLLAHVLAHEIGHILQGSDQHSYEGVMKSRWNPADYARMARQPLPFSDPDIQMVYRGMEARTNRLQGSGSASRSN